VQVAADPYHFAHAFTGEAKHDGILNFPPRALAAAAVIAGASQLWGCSVTNTNAADQYLFFFDGASVPGSGAAPGGPAGIKVATGETLFLLWLPPRQFSAGIVVANSTSQTSFTAGAADCWFDVQYR
jgi:hypothetical protein